MKAAIPVENSMRIAAISFLEQDTMPTKVPLCRHSSARRLANIRGCVAAAKDFG